MKTGLFVAALTDADSGKNDLTWFPRWYARFHEFLQEQQILAREVNREVVVAFCRTLVQSHTPAFHRLQAVRAIAAYHQLVLHTPLDNLDDVRSTLQRLATQERVQ